MTLLAVLVLQADEFFTALFGWNDVLARQTMAGLYLLVGLAYLLFQLLSGRIGAYTYLLWAPGLFVLFLIVSAVSNTLLLPKPLGDWVPAHYIYLPVMICYLLAALRYSERDVVLGLAVAGGVAATVIAVDALVHLEFVKFFTRRSIFDIAERRVVILGYEVVFCAVLAFAGAWMQFGRAASGVFLYVIVFALFYLESQVIQTRLALLNMGLSILLLIYWDRKRGSFLRLAFANVMLIGALLVAPIVLDRYLDLLSQRDLITSNQYNVYIRIQTAEFYLRQFAESYGLGIGMMSPNAGVANPLRAGMALQFNIVDVGLAAALFQFGLPGLAAVCFLTINAAYSAFRAFRVLSGWPRVRAAAVAAMVIGAFIAPIPANFFSISSTTYLGGILIYLTWYYRRVVVQHRQTRDSRSASPVRRAVVR